MGLRWTIATVGALLTAAGLAGCSGSGSSTASPEETTVASSAVPSRSTTPSAVRTAPPAGPASTGAPPASPDLPSRITVHRTGGFVGVEQTLAVRPDGRWTWGGADAGGGPGDGRLTAAQRAELAGLAASPELAAEARRRPGPVQCADGFNYTLTVGSLTVTWVDCDLGTPPTAVAITDLLAAATPL